MSDADPTSRTTSAFYAPLVVSSAVTMVAAGIALVIVMLRSTLGPFAFFTDPGLDRVGCVTLYAVGDDAQRKVESWVHRAPRRTAVELESKLVRALQHTCPVLLVHGVALEEAELEQIVSAAREGRRVALVGNVLVRGGDPLAGIETDPIGGARPGERRARVGAGLVGWVAGDPDGGAEVTEERAAMAAASRSLVAWLLRVPFAELTGDASPEVFARVEPEGPRRFLLSISNRADDATAELALRIHLNREAQTVDVGVTTLSLGGSEAPRSQRLARAERQLDLVVPPLGARSSRTYTLDLFGMGADERTGR